MLIFIPIVNPARLNVVRAGARRSLSQPPAMLSPQPHKEYACHGTTIDKSLSDSSEESEHSLKIVNGMRLAGMQHAYSLGDKGARELKRTFFLCNCPGLIGPKQGVRSICNTKWPFNVAVSLLAKCGTKAKGRILSPTPCIKVWPEASWVYKVASWVLPIAEVY